jgi:N-acetylglutamate synthase-like GNAT family acetyltransferase
VIRGYAPPDRPAVAKLLNLVVDEARVDALLDAAGALKIVLVDELEAAVRGVVLLEVVTWSPEADLRVLVVGSAWRGQGVGQGLLHAAERLAQRRGAESVGIDVPACDTVGAAFLSRSGFARVSEVPAAVAQTTRLEPVVRYSRSLD